jgi:hypothetical protein
MIESRSNRWKGHVARVVRNVCNVPENKLKERDKWRDLDLDGNSVLEFYYTNRVREFGLIGSLAFV